MKTTLPEDLRTGKGGGSTIIETSVRGQRRLHWYQVGDAAQAIKRIEQDLHDNPPYDWTSWRELWIVGGGPTATGLLCIADDPLEAVRMFCESGSRHRVPHYMLDLNRDATRALVGQHLGENLGKCGTSDLIS